MAGYLKLDEVASELALTLGSNCKKRRAELGMSQAELAERSGVAASHLSHIEQGKAHPTLEVLQQLAEGLQTTVLDLLAGPGEGCSSHPIHSWVHRPIGRVKHFTQHA